MLHRCILLFVTITVTAANIASEFDEDGLKPSTSCILFSHAGCRAKCTLLCNIFQCTSYEPRCESVFCDCHERIPTKYMAWLNGQHVELPPDVTFRQLLLVKFMRTPVFRDLDKVMPTVPQLEKQVREYLYTTELSGHELKHALKQNFPQLKYLFRRLRPRPLAQVNPDTSAEVLREGIIEEDEQPAYFKSWFSSPPKQPKKFDINSPENKARIIKLIKEIPNKQDLLDTFKALKNTKEKPLYDSICRYFLHEGLTMPDGTVIVKPTHHQREIDKRLQDDYIMKAIQDKMNESIEMKKGAKRKPETEDSSSEEKTHKKRKTKHQPTSNNGWWKPSIWGDGNSDQPTVENTPISTLSSKPTDQGTSPWSWFSPWGSSGGSQPNPDGSMLNTGNNPLFNSPNPQNLVPLSNLQTIHDEENPDGEVIRSLPSQKPSKKKKPKKMKRKKLRKIKQMKPLENYIFDDVELPKKSPKKSKDNPRRVKGRKIKIDQSPGLFDETPVDAPTSKIKKIKPGFTTNDESDSDESTIEQVSPSRIPKPKKTKKAKIKPENVSQSDESDSDEDAFDKFTSTATPPHKRPKKRKIKSQTGPDSDNSDLTSSTISPKRRKKPKSQTAPISDQSDSDESTIELISPKPKKPKKIHKPKPIVISTIDEISPKRRKKPKSQTAPISDQSDSDESTIELISPKPKKPKKIHKPKPIVIQTSDESEIDESIIELIPPSTSSNPSKKRKKSKKVSPSVAVPMPQNLVQSVEESSSESEDSETQPKQLKPKRSKKIGSDLSNLPKKSANTPIIIPSSGADDILQSMGVNTDKLTPLPEKLVPNDGNNYFVDDQGRIFGIPKDATFDSSTPLPKSATAPILIPSEGANEILQAMGVDTDELDPLPSQLVPNDGNNYFVDDQGRTFAVPKDVDLSNGSAEKSEIANIPITIPSTGKNDILQTMGTDIDQLTPLPDELVPNDGNNYFMDDQGRTFAIPKESDLSYSAPLKSANPPINIPTDGANDILQSMGVDIDNLIPLPAKLVPDDGNDYFKDDQGRIFAVPKDAEIFNDSSPSTKSSTVPIKIPSEGTNEILNTMGIDPDDLTPVPKELVPNDGNNYFTDDQGRILAIPKNVDLSNDSSATPKSVNAPIKIPAEGANEILQSMGIDTDDLIPIPKELVPHDGNNYFTDDQGRVFVIPKNVDLTDDSSSTPKSVNTPIKIPAEGANEILQSMGIDTDDLTPIPKELVPPDGNNYFTDDQGRVFAIPKNVDLPNDSSSTPKSVNAPIKIPAEGANEILQSMGIDTDDLTPIPKELVPHDGNNYFSDDQGRVFAIPQNVDLSTESVSSPKSFKAPINIPSTGTSDVLQSMGVDTEKLIPLPDELVPNDGNNYFMDDEGRIFAVPKNSDLDSSALPKSDNVPIDIPSTGTDQVLQSMGIDPDNLVQLPHELVPDDGKNYFVDDQGRTFTVPRDVDLPTNSSTQPKSVNTPITIPSEGTSDVLQSMGVDTDKLIPLPDELVPNDGNNYFMDNDGRIFAVPKNSDIDSSALPKSDNVPINIPSTGTDEMLQSMGIDPDNLVPLPQELVPDDGKNYFMDDQGRTFAIPRDVDLSKNSALPKSVNTPIIIPSEGASEILQSLDVDKDKLIPLPEELVPNDGNNYFMNDQGQIFAVPKDADIGSITPSKTAITPINIPSEGANEILQSIGIDTNELTPLPKELVPNDGNDYYMDDNGRTFAIPKDVNLSNDSSSPTKSINTPIVIPSEGASEILQSMDVNTDKLIPLPDELVPNDGNNYFMDDQGRILALPKDTDICSTIPSNSSSPPIKIPSEGADKILQSMGIATDDLTPLPKELVPNDDKNYFMDDQGRTFAIPKDVNLSNDSLSPSKSVNTPIDIPSTGANDILQSMGIDPDKLIPLPDETVPNDGKNYYIDDQGRTFAIPKSTDLSKDSSSLPKLASSPIAIPSDGATEILQSMDVDTDNLIPLPNELMPNDGNNYFMDDQGRTFAIPEDANLISTSSKSATPPINIPAEGANDILKSLDVDTDKLIPLPDELVPTDGNNYFMDDQGRIFAIPKDTSLVSNPLEKCDDNSSAEGHAMIKPITDNSNSGSHENRSDFVPPAEEQTTKPSISTEPKEHEDHKNVSNLQELPNFASFFSQPSLSPDDVREDEITSDEIPSKITDQSFTKSKSVLPLSVIPPDGNLQDIENDPLLNLISQQPVQILDLSPEKSKVFVSPDIPNESLFPNNSDDDLNILGGQSLIPKVERNLPDEITSPSENLFLPPSPSTFNIDQSNPGSDELDAKPINKVTASTTITSTNSDEVPLLKDFSSQQQKSSEEIVPKRLPTPSLKDLLKNKQNEDAPFTNANASVISPLIVTPNGQILENSPLDAEEIVTQTDDSSPTILPSPNEHSLPLDHSPENTSSSNFEIVTDKNGNPIIVPKTLPDDSPVRSSFSNIPSSPEGLLSSLTNPSSRDILTNDASDNLSSPSPGPKTGPDGTSILPDGFKLTPNGKIVPQNLQNSQIAPFSTNLDSSDSIKGNNFDDNSLEIAEDALLLSPSHDSTAPDDIFDLSDISTPLRHPNDSSPNEHVLGKAVSPLKTDPEAFFSDIPSIRPEILSSTSNVSPDFPSNVSQASPTTLPNDSSAQDISPSDFPKSSNPKTEDLLQKINNQRDILSFPSTIQGQDSPLHIIPSNGNFPPEGLLPKLKPTNDNPSIDEILEKLSNSNSAILPNFTSNMNNADLSNTFPTRNIGDLSSVGSPTEDDISRSIPPITTSSSTLTPNPSTPLMNSLSLDNADDHYDTSENSPSTSVTPCELLGYPSNVDLPGKNNQSGSSEESHQKSPINKNEINLEKLSSINQLPTGSDSNPPSLLINSLSLDEAEDDHNDTSENSPSTSVTPCELLGYPSNVDLPAKNNSLASSEESPSSSILPLTRNEINEEKPSSINQLPNSIDSSQISAFNSLDEPSALPTDSAIIPPSATRSLSDKNPSMATLPIFNTQNELSPHLIDSSDVPRSMTTPTYQLPNRSSVDTGNSPSGALPPNMLSPKDLLGRLKTGTPISQNPSTTNLPSSLEAIDSLDDFSEYFSDESPENPHSKNSIQILPKIDNIPSPKIPSGTNPIVISPLGEDSLLSQQQDNIQSELVSPNNLDEIAITPLSATLLGQSQNIPSPKEASVGNNLSDDQSSIKKSPSSPISIPNTVQPNHINSPTTSDQIAITPLQLDDLSTLSSDELLPKTATDVPRSIPLSNNNKVMAPQETSNTPNSNISPTLENSRPTNIELNDETLPSTKFTPDDVSSQKSDEVAITPLDLDNLVTPPSSPSIAENAARIPSLLNSDSITSPSRTDDLSGVAITPLDLDDLNPTSISEEALPSQKLINNPSPITSSAMDNIQPTITKPDDIIPLSTNFTPNDSPAMTDIPDMVAITPLNPSTMTKPSPMPLSIKPSPQNDNKTLQNSSINSTPSLPPPPGSGVANSLKSPTPMIQNNPHKTPLSFAALDDMENFDDLEDDSIPWLDEDEEYLDDIEFSDESKDFLSSRLKPTSNLFGNLPSNQFPLPKPISGISANTPQSNSVPPLPIQAPTRDLDSTFSNPKNFPLESEDNSASFADSDELKNSDVSPQIKNLSPNSIPTDTLPLSVPPPPFSSNSINPDRLNSATQKPQISSPTIPTSTYDKPIPPNVSPPSLPFGPAASHFDSEELLALSEELDVSAAILPVPIMKPANTSSVPSASNILPSTPSTPKSSSTIPPNSLSSLSPKPVPPAFATSKSENPKPSITSKLMNDGSEELTALSEELDVSAPVLPTPIAKISPSLSAPNTSSTPSATPTKLKPKFFTSEEIPHSFFSDEAHDEDIDSPPKPPKFIPLSSANTTPKNISKPVTTFQKPLTPPVIKPLNFSNPPQFTNFNSAISSNPLSPQTPPLNDSYSNSNASNKRKNAALNWRERLTQKKPLQPILP